jgi:hypothetical protein
MGRGNNVYTREPIPLYPIVSDPRRIPRRFHYNPEFQIRRGTPR